MLEKERHGQHEVSPLCMSQRRAREESFQRVALPSFESISTQSPYPGRGVAAPHALARPPDDATCAPTVGQAGGPRRWLSLVPVCVLAEIAPLGVGWIG